MPLEPITACNARIRVDNAAGVLADISGESNNFVINFEHQTGEYKTFYDAIAEDWFRVTQCGRKADGTVKVIYDQKNSSARALLETWWRAGGARTISVDVPRDVGGVNYEFEAVLETYSVELDPASADAIFVEFAYKTDGMVEYTDIIS